MPRKTRSTRPPVIEDDRARCPTYIGTVRISMCVIVCMIPVLVWFVPPGHAAERTAALLDAPLPERDTALVDALAAELEQAGYAVARLDFAGLCDPVRLAAEEIDLLVLPDSATLPAAGKHSLVGFLGGGGDLIALRAPLWQRAVIETEGRWRTVDAIQRGTAGVPPPHILFAFKAGRLTGWERSSNRPERTTQHETVADSPAPGRRALHVTITGLDGWDTYGSPAIETPFPPGHTLTVFSAKGGPRTRQLAVEWREKDNSRWIAVVPLFAEWRRYVLAPKDFRFWESNRTRGGRGDTFHPENAVRMTVGLAFSHTGHMGGDHEYWVGPFGTARRTPEHEALLHKFTPPKLDTLCPAYKLFDAHDVAALRVRPDQLVIEPDSIPLAETVRCPHPRPRGAGFDKGRESRWIPLLEARTADGRWRGTPVTLLVHADGKFRGGTWASFGIADRAWYRAPAVLRSIGRIARRMRDGVFIIDGGTNYYTYFEHQKIRLGLRATNPNPRSRRNLTARVSLVDASSGSLVLKHEWSLAIKPQAQTSVAATWKPPHWPEVGFRVTAELVENGRAIDRLVHDAHVWKPKPVKHFITVKDADFQLDGRRWRAHGVNYMPSSGVGLENWADFEHWIGAGAYDPEVIQRDLEHIKALGLNAVSIFIHHRSLIAQNLLDLLRRLDALGLKANLSLRPGTPMDFPWPKIRALLEHYRIAEHDTVFALDLAWEPMFGKHADRQRWDASWARWIEERYGSIENAERDWGFPVPRDDAGKITNPSRPQTTKDGQWHRMTAAYRRFLDTLLYEKYSAARRLVRTIDPNHLVSFRMTEAGNPTFNWGGRIPYDFPYLAAAVDILEPEAYGRIGDWERVKPGWFEYEYARWAAPGLPVMWAEMGVSAWDRADKAATPNRLAFQADYYRHFYRMLIRSGADGVFSWWYPGGFRTNENSDYGIINPDGSDRPVTQVIREHARAFLDGPSPRPIDHWIEIDRDAHPAGVSGIYAQAREAFWTAIDDGRVPGLRTQGTGTNSAQCPLLAVGNTPCNGSNPPKYLDAAFDRVEVRGADGRWTPVESGTKLRVRADQPVTARITLTNLGEAAWLTPGQTRQRGLDSGAVYVVAEGSSSTRTGLPKPVAHLESTEIANIALAPHGVTEPTEVVITLLAEGRTRFGPKFRIRLEP